jgi:alpha-1,2-mannosyltransferase
VGKRRDQTQRLTIFAIVAISACLAFMTIRLTGFPPASDFSFLTAKGVYPDSIHERALGWEALWGDPYRPLGEVMSEHGYAGWAGSVSPRPPSALLLQTTLLVIPRRAFMPTMALLVAALLVWVGWMSQKISGLDPWRFLTGAALLLMSLPVLTALTYIPALGLLAVALLVASWRYQDRRWAGILLGVSTALRLWPGLVVLGFWLTGRRRLARDAIGTFLGLSLLGLLLPGVTVGGSIDSLLTGGDFWLNHNMNSSLALVLWPLGVPTVLSVVLVVAVGLWLAARNRAYAVPITILAALLASPLSWPTYALAVVPVAALYARWKSAATILCLCGALATWPLWPSQWFGHLHFAVLAVMLVLVVRTRALDLTRLETRSDDREVVLERIT